MQTMMISQPRGRAIRGQSWVGLECCSRSQRGLGPASGTFPAKVQGLNISGHVGCSLWPACMRAQLLSRVRLFVTPQIIACQAPLSMGFSRQEYWSGLLLPTPKDLLNPGTEPVPPALAGGFFTTEPSEKFTVSVAATWIPHVTWKLTQTTCKQMSVAVWQ